MKKLLLGALVALLPLTGFAATIFGFQAGGGSWTHDPSGNFTASTSDVSASADLKNGLKLSEKSEGYFYFLIEHPVPLIPNLKYVNTKLSSSGSGNIDASFSVNGKNYPINSSITSSLVIDQTDTILYYEILDNDLVSFDIGLNAKKIEGKLTAVTTTPANNESVTFSETVPMLYGAVEIGLPAGLSLAGEISTISYSGVEFSDVTAKVMYTTDFMLGVEAGVRTQTIKVDVDSVKTDIAFSGVFAGVYFRF